MSPPLLTPLLPPLLTPSSAHPVLDPAIQQFVEERQDRSPGPLRRQPLDAVRRAFAQAQAPQDPLPEVTAQDLALSPELSLRILRPPGLPAPAPAVLYLHGGGWIMGGRDTHARLMGRLAIEAGAAVIFVDYALAPEARHPVQRDQAWTALLAIAERARDLGLDPDRLAAAGDGAGGALAASLALRAARLGPPLRAQALFCPITAPIGQAALAGPFADGPGPAADDFRYFQDCLGEAAVADEDGPYVLDVPLRRLASAPPALVITAEADVARDDGEAYARRLMRAGVAVTALRVAGAIHDFMVLEALRDTPQALAAVAQAGAFLRAAFEG